MRLLDHKGNTFDNRREKYGITVEHRIDSELARCEEPCLPVFCCKNSILFIKLLVEASLSLQSSH